MTIKTEATTRRNTSTDLALIATLAAVTAVCAVVAALPFGVNGVPITLQNFAVFLAGAVLGARRGFLALLLYLALGAIGLPVFAGGSGGLAPFVGATAGYLLSYPFIAAIIGFGVERVRSRGLTITTGAIITAGLMAELCNWVAGSVGISLYAGTPWWPTFVGAAIYVPGDLVKLVLAAVVAASVHRAFPQLLDRR